MLRLNGRLGPGFGKASRGHDEKSDVRVEGEFDVELFSPGSSPAIGDAEFGGLSSAFRSSGFFFLPIKFARARFVPSCRRKDRLRDTNGLRCG